MSRSGALAAIVPAVLLLGTPAHAETPVVAGGVRADGIAAVVGGTAPGRGVDVVLHSDVELRARIRLSGEGGGGPATARLTEERRRLALDEIVGEVLIAREADRIQVTEPDEADVQSQLAKLEELAGGQERLDRLLRAIGATQREVRKTAERRALVDAFLRANLEGTTVVTEAEVERIYRTGEHPFVDRPLEEARAPLRAWVARRALERAVRRWVGVLRARTELRVMARYGSELAEAREATAIGPREKPQPSDDTGR